LEDEMAIARQSDRRKGIGRKGGRRKGDGDIELIKAEAKKILVRSEPSREKKTISVWNWHEEFTKEWSETFITNKKKKSTKGE
jgi:hypothetical protein